jgi:hypothetical protein
LTLKTLPWIERSETSAEGVECKPFTRAFQDETVPRLREVRRNGGVDVARRLLDKSETPPQRAASGCGFTSRCGAFLRRIGAGRVTIATIPAMIPWELSKPVDMVSIDWDWRASPAWCAMRVMLYRLIVTLRPRSCQAR